MKPRLDILPTVFSWADLQRFDSIIDVRSPAEFAEDHVPGAINCPVLDNTERAQVGTLHKQTSAFDAKKRGAALVARNIARHLEAQFADQPRSWKPLIYCWRGGSRSGAMTHILKAIGWHAVQLEGGYQSYRAQVRSDLESLPQRFSFNIVCGRTGSGKSRLLEELAKTTAQVLDLEQLAVHRGSVLGDLPDQPQPSQKRFDSLIWAALNGFDPDRPVWAEAESKRVGALRVPDALMEQMRGSPCFALETTKDARIKLLREEYRHLIDNPQLLGEKLDCLVELHSKQQIEHWKAQAAGGQWDALVGELLDKHYDPAYGRSSHRNYAGLANATPVALDDVSQQALQSIVQKLAQR